MLTQNYFGEMVYYLLIIVDIKRIINILDIFYLIVVDTEYFWRDGLLIINYCRQKRIIKLLGYIYLIVVDTEYFGEMVY